MGLFGGKKKEMIPEVGSSGPPSASSRGGPPSIAPSQAPSYRSTAPSYVPPSQGGTGYQQSSHWAQPGQQQQQQQYQQPQQRPPSQQSGGYGQYNQRPGGPGDRDNNKMRNALLSGARNAPPGGGVGGKQDPYAGRGGGTDQYGGAQQQQQQGEMNEEDEEVEGIKQQMRYVKQESLASTRNALRIAQEAEETARATLDKLGEQSDRIANTERHLDLAKAHNERAVDETKELEALNRSIFRPNMTWNKKGKRDKEEARLIARHNQEKEEREQVRRDQYESRQRIEGAYKGMDRDAENAAGAKARARARGAERQRYQFEADDDDNAVEDEIDDNLDALGGVAGRLKMLAMASGAEVDAQNNKLTGLSGKVDRLDVKIGASTRKLAGIK